MEVSKLNEKQREIFNRFKISVKDCQLPFDDIEGNYLLKWLSARSFNEDQAEKMLRKSLEWRKMNRIDNLLDEWEIPEVMDKYHSMGVCGNDKFACPVWVCAYGNTDMKGIMMSVNMKTYVRYHAYVSERSHKEMHRLSQLAGKSITTQTIILDMENLSSKQMGYKPVREAGIEMAKQAEANYPETLRRIFIINAPKFFTLLFAIVRPLMAQVTLDKIRVFGSDKSEWSAALLEDIDADQLPAHYGGTMTDPDGDPKCPSKFNMGGLVPKSYYFAYNKPVPTSDMVKAVIPSSNKLKLKFEITCPVILKWEFFTEDGDIGINIFHRKDDTKVDIIPNERIDSHLFKHEGEIVCKELCTHTVVFDNTFSYLRSKTLWYKFTIAYPTAKEIEETYLELRGL